MFLIAMFACLWAGWTLAEAYETHNAATAVAGILLFIMGAWLMNKDDRP